MSLSDEELDKLILNIQEQSFEDARRAFGEKGFDRWRNPKFNGIIADADGMARVTGGCGDTMEIYLKFAGGRVEKASYRTDGCGSSSLCGSFTAELAHGRTADELLELDPEDILNTIGTFPDDDKHCATLSISALQEALDDYMIKETGKQ